MKDIELKLISELMKNSRRSDRELAKAIGVSQPTVSRMIRKLEKEGIVKEYTMIPDFAKLGYELMNVSFVRMAKGVKPEEHERIKEAVIEDVQKNVFPDLLLESGSGLGSDGVIITLHRSFSDFTKQMRYVKEHSLLNTENVESFLIDLKAKFHYRSLTLSLIADDIQRNVGKKEGKLG